MSEDSKRIRVILGGSHRREPARAVLSAHPAVELIAVDDVVDAIGALEDADALMIPGPKTADGTRLAEALRTGRSPLRWVQVLTAGHEGLTANPLPEQLIVTNQGGAIATTVAEHTLALTLACTRQIPAVLDNVRRRAWDRHFDRPMMSLEGRDVTIIGFGHVGRQVAVRMRSLGARIVGVNSDGRPDPMADLMLPLDRFREALHGAAVVIVAIALSRNTWHLMNEAAFAACSPGAIFVNVSRGGTVDQQALAQALRAGIIGAAAIDVTDPEPLPADDQLWDAPNLIISPHSAGAGSTRSDDRLADVIGENIERFLRGRPMLHRVATNE